MHFTLIIYKQFNFSRFRASAYTNVDRLCAVFLYNIVIYMLTFNFYHHQHCNRPETSSVNITHIVNQSVRCVNRFGCLLTGPDSSQKTEDIWILNP